MMLYYLLEPWPAVQVSVPAVARALQGLLSVVRILAEIVNYLHCDFKPDVIARLRPNDHELSSFAELVPNLLNAQHLIP